MGQGCVYLFKRKGCSNCPAAEAVVDEIAVETGVKVVKVNADNIGINLEYKLLEEQIFVFATPVVVIEDENGMVLHSAGTVPKYKKLKKIMEEL